MPVINFNLEDLKSLIGTKMEDREVLDRIPMIGADFHDFDPVTKEASIEFFPNRPDLYSVEGLARALRSFFDIELGMRTYDMSASDIVMRVEPSVKNVRPYVVGAVIRGVVLDDKSIRSLMELQEKLHLTVGRKRAKVAIGVHDLDKVHPPFVYKAVSPTSISFVPLAKEEMMTLAEVLEKHEKGKDYKQLLDGKELYPVILDAKNDVLSFPPIINGRLTTVTTETKNLFIDVTGTDQNTISGVLNIVCTSIAERGGVIETITLRGEEKGMTPNLRPKQWLLDVDKTNAALGLDLEPLAMCQCLTRMGYSAEPKGRKVKVSSSPVRMDLIHQADVVEDVAIGYGYENFGNSKPLSRTIGGERRMEKVADLVRQMMVGYGHWEVTTLTLSSMDEQFSKVPYPEVQAVEVLNPVSEDHNCLRVQLIPSLLTVLRRSKHRDLPQRIFEVGDVVVDAKRRKHMAVMSVHSKASFTEMKSLAEGVLKELGVQCSLVPGDLGMFIPGRCAMIKVNGRTVGHFGELHPQVITAYEIGYPIIAFELDLQDLMSGRGEKIV
ncbi:MAG TPA: phenylalanine--tRNA ligase subunit beta [Methanomassiliicoccales archaeon]|nr:phenylalanine--tRNA ligase subunit beta [Methanomassiliicoccales archaeon]HPR98863.1 phenylalanine--tRNA ligase subunit beta [Methanomassiliicoccales archaeon]